MSNMRWKLLYALVISYGLLLLLSPSNVIAQGWEGSGTITVDKYKCLDNSDCLIPGQYCFNFQCDSCSGSPPVCKQWESGGGCSFVNAYEGQQDGCAAGWWCASGTCVSCQPIGGTCTSDANCCSGTKCDVSNGKCVTCDANKVQNNPAASYGGGECEASCGASSQCDEAIPNSYLTTLCSSGNTKTLDYCSSTCQYGDTARCALTCGSTSQCSGQCQPAAPQNDADTHPEQQAASPRP